MSAYRLDFGRTHAVVRQLKLPTDSDICMPNTVSEAHYTKLRGENTGNNATIPVLQRVTGGLAFIYEEIVPKDISFNNETNKSKTTEVYIIECNM
jgi:hypothetical protein